MPLSPSVTFATARRLGLVVASAVALAATPAIAQTASGSPDGEPNGSGADELAPPAAAPREAGGNAGQDDGRQEDGSQDDGPEEGDQAADDPRDALAAPTFEPRPASGADEDAQRTQVGAPDDRPLPPPPPRPASGGRGYAGRAWQGSRAPAGPRRPRGVFRPLSVTMGLGPGLISQRFRADRETDGGLAWMVRIGLGVAPNWQVTLAWQGATADADNAPGGPGEFALESLSLGAQYFLHSHLYLRGALGSAAASLDDDSGVFVLDRSGALSLGVGYELARAPFVALAVELFSDIARIQGETWHSGGLALAVSLF